MSGPLVDPERLNTQTDYTCYGRPAIFWEMDRSHYKRTYKFLVVRRNFEKRDLVALAAIKKRKYLIDLHSEQYELRNFSPAKVQEHIRFG